MTQNDHGFIKLIRNSSKYFMMLEERPTAFLLLSLIANRARRTNEKDLMIDLEIGEALIGDFFAYGVTRAVYRTDKEYLMKNGFILTIRADRRGTIVKLINSDIFDINPTICSNEATSNKRINITRENNTLDNIIEELSPENLLLQEINNTEEKI